jgi:peroxiredoxin Q/BCP
MPRLAAGDLAPDFKLPDQDGVMVSLADLRRKVGKSGSVVVYFYPADDTPGCTKEACQFNDGQDKHNKFRSKYGLGIRLLSDPEHVAMIPYGAYGAKTLYGKQTVGVIRSTFLIGANGKIRRAWYSVRADGHAAKVLAEAAT